MIRMFVRHPVKDFPAWKKAYDNFDEARRSMGVKGQAVFQAATDPNDVTVWHDFDSLESAQAFAGSTRLKDVMEQAGVAGQPAIWYGREA